MDSIVDECRGVAILQESELNSLIKIWQTMIDRQCHAGAIGKLELKDRALGAVEIYQTFKAAMKPNDQF